MFELIHVCGNTWYIKSPTNVGLFVTDSNKAILIDSGNSKEYAIRILSILRSKNWDLKMIINTHSNADHVGGNSYFQEKTNCRIAATRAEGAFISDPFFESSFLFGAYPNSKMRNKFLLAQPSKVTDIISYDCKDGLIADTTLKAISLPGHFMDMIGVMTPDKVFFAGDSLFSSNVLNKYQITFLYDVKNFIQTLDKLEQMDACLFIPSHADSTDDIKQLVKTNRDKINEVIDTILKYCDEPINFEDLLKKLFDHYGLILDFNQYILVGSTVKSYLSYLYDSKQIEAIFENNILLWKKI